MSQGSPDTSADAATTVKLPPYFRNVDANVKTLLTGEDTAFDLFQAFTKYTVTVEKAYVLRARISHLDRCLKAIAVHEASSLRDSLTDERKRRIDALIGEQPALKRAAIELIKIAGENEAIPPQIKDKCQQAFDMLMRKDMESEGKS
ncbi:hypothetical protein ACLMJK_006315 [Lecanora helva]